MIPGLGSSAGKVTGLRAGAVLWVRLCNEGLGLGQKKNVAGARKKQWIRSPKAGARCRPQVLGGGGSLEGRGECRYCFNASNLDKIRQANKPALFHADHGWQHGEQAERRLVVLVENTCRS